MKEVLFFYLPDCPYCNKASELIAEIKKEYPLYAKIAVHEVDESLNANLADKFDYNLVPCMFVDGVKVIEGECDKDKIVAMFKDIVG